MKIVGHQRLVEFKRKYSDVRSQVDAWLAEAEEATWQTSQAIKARYPSASFLVGNQVVFNLKGNNYRLVVKIAYKTQVVQVLKIGTHAEYNTWKL